MPRFWPRGADYERGRNGTRGSPVRIRRPIDVACACTELGEDFNISPQRVCHAVLERRHRIAKLRGYVQVLRERLAQDDR